MIWSRYMYSVYCVAWLSYRHPNTITEQAFKLPRLLDIELTSTWGCSSCFAFLFVESVSEFCNRIKRLISGCPYLRQARTRTLQHRFNHNSVTIKSNRVWYAKTTTTTEEEFLFFQILPFSFCQLHLLPAGKQLTLVNSTQEDWYYSIIILIPISYQY